MKEHSVPIIYRSNYNVQEYTSIAIYMNIYCKYLYLLCYNTVHFDTSTKRWWHIAYSKYYEGLTKNLISLFLGCFHGIKGVVSTIIKFIFHLPTVLPLHFTRALVELVITSAHKFSSLVTLLIAQSCSGTVM